jgi:hypothetical protein
MEERAVTGEMVAKVETEAEALMERAAMMI